MKSKLKRVLELGSLVCAAWHAAYMGTYVSRSALNITNILTHFSSISFFIISVRDP
jgi:hypothetical protein